MVEYILGKYMVSKGTISEAQLDEILKEQDKIRVKLGLIAVDKGFMTEKEANEVNRLQEIRDKRFGDIAIEEGYLSKEQLDELLALQGNAYMQFAQGIVDAGITDIDKVNESIVDLCKEYGLSESAQDILKSDDVEQIIPLFIPIDQEDVKDAIGNAVRSIIRTIDRHAYIEMADLVRQMNTGKMVIQNVEGDTELMTGFLEGDGGMINVASVYGREEFKEFDEDVMDAAAEYLNCVNGIYVSELDGKGLSAGLYPPEYGSAEWEIEDGLIIKVPIYVNNKKMYFVVIKLG